jgi:hypothetical protein
MSRLTKNDRLTILEFASEIASEAAQNPNVVWMIEFQEHLVEALYRKMTDLIEADLEMAEEEEEDYEEEDEEESAAVEPEDEEDDEIRKKSKDKKTKKAA